MDLETFANIIIATVTVATFINSILLKLYNGKFKNYHDEVFMLRKKVETLDKKMDELVERISKLEQDVKWLVRLNKR